MRWRRRAASAEAATPWTPVVWLVLWVSMMVGYLKGYTAGSGVLTNMQFRQQWFPEADQVTNSLYEGLDLGDAVCYASLGPASMFLALKFLVASAASLPAGWVLRSQGRRLAILAGCAAYCMAHLLQGAAVNLPMLLAGQVFHGIAAAFLYQAPPIEVVEVAPHQWRGAFVFSDSVGRAVGTWSRSLMHAGLGSSSSSPAWGWRLSSLFPLWPALVVMMLVPLIPETPNSLIQRGQLDAGRAALQEIRGPLHNIDGEFAGILKAAGISHTTKRPPFQLRVLFRKQQLPPLLLLLLLTVLRDCTGADTVRLFSRPFWEAVHWTKGRHGFFYQQIENAFYAVAVVFSVFAIDSWGRRPLMAASAAGCGLGFLMASIATAVKERQDADAVPIGLQATMYAAMIISFSSYVAGVAGGYWLLMAELFPLATRPLAASLLTGLVMLAYCIASLVAMPLVCSVQLGLLLFYTGGNVLMLLAVLLLLPETKHIALEDVYLTFQQHWFWRRFNQQQQQQQEQQRRLGGQQHSNPRHHHSPPPGPYPGVQGSGSLPHGVLHSVLGQHSAAAAAGAAHTQQQQGSGDHPASGAAPGGSSAASQQQQAGREHSSSSMLAGFAAHAWHMQPEHAPAADSRGAARALSMQPAGTMSIDLEEFKYGKQ